MNAHIVNWQLALPEIVLSCSGMAILRASSPAAKKPSSPPR